MSDSQLPDTTDDDPTGLDALFDDNTDDGSFDQLFDDEESMTDDTDTTDGSTDSDELETDGSVAIYDEKRFRNGDVLAILLTQLGGGYQALAMEADGGGQILATERIGNADDRQTAEGMCEYWFQQHEKGILDPEQYDEGGGIMSGIAGMFGGGGESA